MQAEAALPAKSSLVNKMKRIAKNNLRIIAALATVIVLCLAVVAVYLIYPGTPGKSKFMKFEGYIELPKSGPLNVLDYLAISNDTLFVTSESSGALFKVDIDPNRPSRSTVSELPGRGSAHGVALMIDRNVAFITRSEENTVDVFNPTSLRQLARIPVADDADAILYVPSAKLVYVVHGDGKIATLIDPEKRVTVGTIALPGKPEFPALDSQTGFLYQNLEDINSIVAIDLGKRAVIGQWSIAPCEGPSGMAINSEQRRLFAVCSRNATLVVFDLESHRVITSLKIGGGPDSVAFDGVLHRIYSAGKAGRLTVIQQDGPNSYRVLDEIHTHYGAHTLALDPVSHRVFVAYASLFAHPRISVFSPTMVNHVQSRKVEGTSYAVALVDPTNSPADLKRGCL
jgi:DNA-binding beta-propeller fold protein YncE